MTRGGVGCNIYSLGLSKGVYRDLLVWGGVQSTPNKMTPYNIHT